MDMPDHMTLQVLLDTQILVCFCSIFNSIVISSVIPFQKNYTINTKSTTCDKPAFTNYCNRSIVSWEYLHVNHKHECYILYLYLLCIIPFVYTSDTLNSNFNKTFIGKTFETPQILLGYFTQQYKKKKYSDFVNVCLS